jgi:glycosyltransferase involved in cell wall biosynthesis
MKSLKRKNITKPKVTVITGYYNRAHALEATIDSIMKQSFEDFEFIVFNDKSTDNTRETLCDIEKKYDDPRLVIINHEENKGFVQGMIDAISMATGKYICVQGSGDVAHHDRLKFQFELLEKRLDVGVVGCFYENYVEDKNITRVRRKVADEITMKDLMDENIFSHGEVMYRKNIYDGVGGYRPEFINCQDQDLWFRMIKVTKFATVPKLLYRRFIRFDGVSYDPRSFLRQTRYSILSCELATLPIVEQENCLANLRLKGIDEIINLKSFKEQKIIVKAVLRSLVWGERNAATSLVRLGLDSSIIQYACILVIYVYESRGFSYFGKKFIEKKCGIT